MDAGGPAVQAPARPMKTPACLAALLLACPALPAQSATPAPAAPLSSAVYNLDALEAVPTKTGVRRPVLHGPTTTLDQLHVHITTLNPGEKSGEPRLHLQEEVIVVREGTVEVHCDGRTTTAGPGAVIFFAARAVTALHNTGTTPATYTVIYYHTPLTPKA